MNTLLQTLPSRAQRLGAVCCAAIALCAVPQAQAQEAATFKLGVVTFLSGPAAESNGVPSANAAKARISTCSACR